MIRFKQSDLNGTYFELNYHLFYGLVHAVLRRQARPLHLRGVFLQLLDVPGPRAEPPPGRAAEGTQQ